MQGLVGAVALQYQHARPLRICRILFHCNCCTQSGNHLAQNNIISGKFPKVVPRHQELALADEINDAIEQGIHRCFYSAALSFRAGAIFSGARPFRSGFRYCPV